MKQASLYHQLNYSEERPQIQRILETPFTKEIRIAFLPNQHMKEHKAPMPIVIEIFEGSISFGVQGITHQLKKGDIITLEASVPHDLTAHEKSIVRLTLSKNDALKRVEKVVSQ